MKKVWKWILGILLVVLVLGALVAAGFYWRNSALGTTTQAGSQPGWYAMPMMRGAGRNFHNGPMMRGDDYGQRIYRGRLFAPFGFLMPLGGLLRLVIFGLLLYGAYWLGRRNARVVIDHGSPALQEPANTTPDQIPPAS